MKLEGYGVVTREAHAYGPHGEDHGPVVVYAGPLAEYDGGLGAFDDGASHITRWYTRFINLTPHAVTIRFDGYELTVPPSGTVARVTTVTEPVDTPHGVPTVRQTYGTVEGLPDPERDTVYIVSALVLAALRGSGRVDVVAPDTGPESAIRDEKGQIVAVRRLVCL